MALDTHRQSIWMILGTRPEAIKMAPVYQQLAARPDVDLTLVSTGQHGAMLTEVLDLFGMRPDHDLGLLRPGQSLAALTGRLLTALDPLLEAHAPDLVLVHGDTATSFGAALACFYRKVRVAHVEAGLRSHRLDSPFPEEFHRQTVARIAQVHLAPTLEARDNLVTDGVDRAAIAVTGSTAVDALEAVRGAEPPAELADLAPDQDLVLVTLHRRETGPAGMDGVLQSLRVIAREHPEVRFLYPVHPSPTYRQAAFRILGDLANVRLTSPLAYGAFVAAMDRARLILTDSGGIQEEAAHLGRPVLLVRDTTERPEAVDAGAVQLVGTQPRRIRAALRRHLGQPGDGARSRSPYMVGSASGRVVEAVLGTAA